MGPILLKTLRDSQQHCSPACQGAKYERKDAKNLLFPLSPHPVKPISAVVQEEKKQQQHKSSLTQALSNGLEKLKTVTTGSIQPLAPSSHPEKADPKKLKVGTNCSAAPRAFFQPLILFSCHQPGWLLGDWGRRKLPSSECQAHGICCAPALSFLLFFEV